jgi:hypothetical protein
MGFGISRVAELARALGRRPAFDLVETAPVQAATSPEPDEATAPKL